VSAVFVHGVPVTAVVWDRLLEALDRDDVVVLQLPGFGAHVPDGFVPTMDRYAEWLTEATSDLDEVDFVGQDWGGLLVLRVVSDRPENVRSWVVDSPNLTSDFVWHDSARGWQAPERGEGIAAWLGSASLTERVDLLVGVGVDFDVAETIAPAIDSTMANAILDLYRSAPDIGDVWGEGLDRIVAPGLCVEAGQDPYRSTGAVRELASRLGAELLVLPESQHFWMLDAPTQAAAGIRAFWASLSDS
jgi:pimeloyl-ACP methyl ester carboxylesterase